MSAVESPEPEEAVAAAAPGANGRRAGLRALATAAGQSILAARGHLLPWAPVFLATGIGSYFGLRAEPDGLVLMVAMAVLAAGIVAALRAPEAWRPPATALALVAGGLLLASLRAHVVAAPVLTFRYYGPVEGRVIAIDRSYSDRIRITLDQVRLRDVADARRPAKVRISLDGDQMGYEPAPGQAVMLTANLAPPGGPVEPGSFDFRRLAWFAGLGAVGYARSPVMLRGPPDDGLSLAAFELRMRLSAAMQRRMDGQAGALGAALMTGDRSGLTAATNDALRASNLSHMVSISGLHMGMLTGFVFALVRYGLALVPAVGLRVHGKKVAAVVALLAATAYMLLAGPDVATRRAYVMAAVMLAAVLADRRALSLRSLAIAALICLVLEPESLVEPGFQMSFGATLALIAGFEHWPRVQARIPPPLRPVALAVLSSLIAGAATGPIAAAHFNRFATFGLVANLLAVPVMGILVMPAGVMAALLAPLGLAQPALWLMEKGCAAILWIGAEVAARQGAVAGVPSPPWPVLPLLGLGGAVLLIGGNRLVRAAGAVGLAAAFGIWALASRPTLLVSEDGTLAGLMTPAGRALSKPRGAGFVAQGWLENDGDIADQETAADRPGFVRDGKIATAGVLGRRFILVTGKGAADRAAGLCAGDAILFLSEDWRGPPGPCQLFDRAALADSGALAIWPGPDAPLVVSARDVTGRRLWSAPGRPPG